MSWGCSLFSMILSENSLLKMGGHGAHRAQSSVAPAPFVAVAIATQTAAGRCQRLRQEPQERGGGGRGVWSVRNYCAPRPASDKGTAVGCPARDFWSWRGINADHFRPLRIRSASVSAASVTPVAGVLAFTPVVAPVPLLAATPGLCLTKTPAPCSGGCIAGRARYDARCSPELTSHKTP